MFQKKYKFREFLIAICMPLYDLRYLSPFNFIDRLWIIHNFTDYYEVHAPILRAAKHCTVHWKNFFVAYLFPGDSNEQAEFAMHYYPM